MVNERIPQYDHSAWKQFVFSHRQSCFRRLHTGLQVIGPNAAAYHTAVDITVNDNDHREIFHLKLTDCLSSKIFITYDLRFCDTFG